MERQKRYVIVDLNGKYEQMDEKELDQIEKHNKKQRIYTAEKKRFPHMNRKQRRILARKSRGKGRMSK